MFLLVMKEYDINVENTVISSHLFTYRKTEAKIPYFLIVNLKLIYLPYFSNTFENILFILRA